MNNTQIYLEVKNKIPAEVNDNTLLNIVTREVNSYTHGFHKYPAKFIPQIPQWAISKYSLDSKTNFLCDPFCGSGTSLVEGVLSGQNAIGIDIDPLSILISKVKTTRIDEYELKKVANWLLAEMEVMNEGTFLPECKTLSHWFTDDAINKLSIIRTLIDQISNKFGKTDGIRDIQDLLIVCFSSIIRRVSNADNESQKTYVSHTRVKIPEEVNTLFVSQLDYFIKRIVKFSHHTNPNSKVALIQSSSAESLKAKLEGFQINLAVTSPPYIKAIDYIYNQMVELFWIGDIFQMQTQTKQNSMKSNYIGNKQIPKLEYKNYDPNENCVGIENIDETLQQIHISDKKNGQKHSYITYKYFLMMDKHFSEMAKCLNRDVHYVMVVGDSNVSGVDVETANFLTKIAEKNGFILDNKWGYKIKNRFMRFDRKGRGGIIEIDWVLDFKKN